MNGERPCVRASICSAVSDHYLEKQSLNLIQNC